MLDARITWAASSMKDSSKSRSRLRQWFAQIRFGSLLAAACFLMFVIGWLAGRAARSRDSNATIAAACHTSVSEAARTSHMPIRAGMQEAKCMHDSCPLCQNVLCPTFDDDACRLFSLWRSGTGQQQSAWSAPRRTRTSRQCKQPTSGPHEDCARVH